MYIVCFASGVYLTGLDAFVQFVQYPSFALLDGAFSAIHAFHTMRIGPLVAPFMVLELLTSLLLFRHKGSMHRLPLFFTAVTWAATFLGAVPSHHDFELRGFSESALDTLLFFDAVRLLAWFTKSLVMTVHLRMLVFTENA